MYARKIAQIAESRRHLRRDCGSLTYRRPKKRARKSSSKREITFSRRRPLFLVFLFLVSQYFFLQSPLFEFQDVEIDGAEEVAGSVIESKLGLAKGANYWELSEESLEANIESMYRVEDAIVNVEFPSRVEVTVLEREPSFYVAYRGDAGKWFSADDEGVILDGSAPPEGTLKFFLSHPIKGGMNVRASDLQVVRFFQDTLKGELRERVRAINIGKKREVTLKVSYTPQPLWVRLGRPERLEYKIFLLRELLSQLAKDKVDVRSIDLRYSAPVVTTRTSKD